MRYLGSLIVILSACVVVLYSCAKWKDPKGYTDPKLTNPYCNDPNAVNYNWGFPGKPDSTVCFYPDALFKGIYLFHDSVYSVTSGLFIGADSFYLTIHSLSKTQISVFGICPSAADSVLLTAGPTFVATVDTMIGDSLTTEGQSLCILADTINGTMTKDRIDSPAVIHVNFQVATDSGTFIHSGSAIIQP